MHCDGLITKNIFTKKYFYKTLVLYYIIHKAEKNTFKCLDRI